MSSVRQDFTYGTPPRFARRKNGYATYQGMYEHNLYSLRYLCTFSYSKNNSKLNGSLLKIYLCDVNKTLLATKVKVRIRHTKPEIYRWRCSGKQSTEHRSGHILSVLSLYQRYICIE